MSIASEISRISGNVSDSLDAVSAKGVTVPSGSNSDNLPTLISQIQTGSNVEPATDAPLMDGTAAVGSSTKYAREDHVHPTDTSRAPAGVIIQNVAIPTSSWAIDSNHTFTDYPYYAAIPVTGMTANMMPEVIFGVDDASSCNFASVCQSAAGYVYIYAAIIPSSSITVLTVTGR